MLPFVTCGQMKILEKRADESGLSYYQMMENAGTKAAELLMGRYPAAISEAKIAVFCGKGNNGGDGFVVARKLAEAGAEVLVILVDGPPVTEDAVTNFGLIQDNLPVLDMKEEDSPFMGLDDLDIIVDAIYGTGFHGQLRPNALKAAAFINHMGENALIFALDIPSGLGGDALKESQIDTNAVKAHCTVTFHNKKPVHLQAFAKKYCGETLIADIGIDEDALW